VPNVTVDVSRAGLWDAEALSDVAAATFPLACPPHATPDDIGIFINDVLSFERFGEYLSLTSHTVLKAVDDDKIVGYVMLIAGEPSDPALGAELPAGPLIEISKMYVLPGRHGTGVATALMNASVELARQTGKSAIWLGVNQHNKRAQRFYTKHGFERIGEKTFQVGSQTHHDFVMCRRLG
jgi:ribosomal protein S18 acetylase RimI-like enzyme